MWIDTHCHLDAAEFAAGLAPSRERARRPAWCIACCRRWRRSTSNGAALAQVAGDSYAWASIRCAPRDASEDDLAVLDRAWRSTGRPRLVAVGEIGWTISCPGWTAAPGALSTASSWRWRARHGLPVLLHVRRSADQLLKQLRRAPVGGIAHAFNGSAQQAREIRGSWASYRRGLRLGHRQRSIKNRGFPDPQSLAGRIASCRPWCSNTEMHPVHDSAHLALQDGGTSAAGPGAPQLADNEPGELPLDTGESDWREPAAVMPAHGIWLCGIADVSLNAHAYRCLLPRYYCGKTSACARLRSRYQSTRAQQPAYSMDRSEHALSQLRFVAVPTQGRRLRDQL
jgi:hypothetical protein